MRPGADAAAPDYADPPVVEVVLAVGFRPIPELGLVRLADLWRAQFRDRFPIVEEQSRYSMPVERLDAHSVQPSVSLQMTPMPPLPRLWFVSEARSELIQIQNDWFARNWRKVDGDAEYGRYPAMRSAFERDFQRLVDFVASGGLGEVVPAQCEITYINHVDASPLDVLGLFARHPARLPAPESVAASLTYPITHEGATIGRIHVDANQAVERSSGKPVTVLNLTARGRPLGAGLNGVLGFLDKGSEQALTVFDQLTSDAMHQKWGRQR